MYVYIYIYIYIYIYMCVYVYICIYTLMRRWKDGERRQSCREEQNNVEHARHWRIVKRGDRIVRVDSPRCVFYSRLYRLMRLRY